jgi:hypothetical protein
MKESNVRRITLISNNASVPGTAHSWKSIFQRGVGKKIEIAIKVHSWGTVLVLLYSWRNVSKSFKFMLFLKNKEGGNNYELLRTYFLPHPIYLSERALLGRRMSESYVKQKYRDLMQTVDRRTKHGLYSLKNLRCNNVCSVSRLRR